MKREARISAPSRAQSSLSSRRDGSPHAGIVSPSEGSVQPTEPVRTRQDPAHATPSPSTPSGTQSPPQGSQPGAGQTPHTQSNIEPCLLGILLGSCRAISPCKHKTHSGQVIPTVDQESVGSFMSPNPCAHASCSSGRALPAPVPAAFTPLRELRSPWANTRQPTLPPHFASKVANGISVYYRASLYSSDALGNPLKKKLGI